MVLQAGEGVEMQVEIVLQRSFKNDENDECLATRGGDSLEEAEADENQDGSCLEDKKEGQRVDRKSNRQK